MREQPQSNLWSFLAFAVVLNTAACGGKTSAIDTTPAAKSNGLPASFGLVPDDTPYLLASLSGNDRLFQHLYGSSATIAKKTFWDYLEKNADAKSSFGKTVAILGKEIADDKQRSWQSHVGLTEDVSYVLYGLSVWPVLRLQLSAPERTKTFIRHAFDVSQSHVTEQTSGSSSYWNITEPPKAGASEPATSIVIAVTATDVALAILPLRVVDIAVPYLLGDKRPAVSLGDSNRVPAILSRYGFTKNSIGFLDAKRVADIFFGRSKDVNQLLRADANVEKNHSMTPGCLREIDQMVQVVPRLVWGMTKLDDAGFTGSAIIELPPVAVSALRTLRSPFAGQSLIPSDSIFAFGGGVDVDAALRLAKAAMTYLRNSPWQCQEFAPLNVALRGIPQTLSNPLPEMAQGLRGFVVVLNDYVHDPMQIDGFAVLEGDHVGLLASMAAIIPGLSGLAANGKAISVPMTAMGLQPSLTGHIAMSDTRAAVALGATGDVRSEKLLQYTPAVSSPLLFMHYNVPRLKEMMAAMGEPRNEFGAWNIETASMTVNVDEYGLRFDMSLSW
jgi:hypothetical protein